MAETQEAKNKRGNPKEREGLVVSDKAEKTIIVSVVRRFKHEQYGKFVNTTKRYSVHDEKSEAREGDYVKIVECRPISKTKKWKLAKVLNRAER